MKTFALVAVGLLLAGPSRARGAGDPLDGHKTQRLLRSVALEREHRALGRHRRAGRHRGSRDRDLREDEPCEIRSREEDRDEFNEIKQRYDIDLDPKSSSAH
jgi:hypothetical protein